MSQSSQPGTGTADVVAFASQLLELIHEASVVTSYKYAVLLALIDLCQENAGQSGASSRLATTRQVAEKVVDLYWPQTLVHGQAGRVLRQINGNRRSIPDLIVKFRKETEDCTSITLHRARHQGGAFQDLVDKVEIVLIRWPIPLLQRLGNQTLSECAEITW